MAAIAVSLAAWLGAPVADAAPETPSAPAEASAGTIFIREYRVQGVRHLSRIQVEETVYPFLGPGRTKRDVEQARAALEKAYRDKGYQTVAVQVPPQQVKNGVVILQVIESTVGRLRVTGARYFSPKKIKEMAPSLAEGKVVNFNEVPRDILALNQLPDRRVTPTLRAGAQLGTVDIDLAVKDKLPLHGSLELNNRYSPNTTSLRVNGSVSDSNFAQLGDSLGLSFQVAPERSADAKVFSGYYLARLQNDSGLSLMLQGTKQDSDVSTLGGVAVVGRGETLGVRTLIALPAGKDFYQSASVGIDYKHFDQNIKIAGGSLTAPITYYPVSASYSATRVAQGSVTEMNAGVTLHLRGMGSNPASFDARRFQADGGFIYFRGDLSQTRDLPLGLQAFGKVQGQLSDRPLLDSEEFSGGGLGTVRGYLESNAVGDNGIFGSLELRSPSFIGKAAKAAGEWRVYVFTDAGRLTITDPLPEQKSRFDLASWGVGSRIRYDDHFNGSLDAGIPLISQSPTKANDVLFTFRIWVEF